MMKNKNAWYKYRTTNFLIGLFTSLVITISGFNYTYFRDDIVFSSEIEDLDEHAVEIQRTVFQKPKPKETPPPTNIETVDIIEVDDVVIKEPDLIPEKITDPNLPIDTSVLTTIQPIEAALPPAPPPPVDIPEPANLPPVSYAQHMAYYGDCNEVETTRDERKTCSDIKFFKYLRKTIKYPALAKENGIQGIVYVEMIIGIDGEIESAKVMRDIGGGCGEEALRAIKNMGKWSPARQGGRRVRLIMRLPVHFVLG